jgi:hypothetical protein
MHKFVENVRYFFDAAKYMARKHTSGYSVNPEPTFDQDGLEFFRLAIKDSRIYLEFGSGGSTILASRFVTKLVSVETDRVFAAAVRRALPQSRAEVHLLTPNIGMTRDWGFPIFGHPTPARIARWKRLPKAPWGILGSDIPDTILIDGRMRVACALECLLHITRDTCLLVDDYMGRSYEAIERFANPIAFHGRMAEFRKRKTFDEAACHETLETAYSDLR